jgi:hypothetical protein
MRNIFLILIAEMMSDTDRLSKKCGAVYRWVISGLICTDVCGSCFHLKCATTSPSAPDRRMPCYCFPCVYKNHVKQQEERIRHVENELKLAREEICKLKAGNVSSNFME